MWKESAVAQAADPASVRAPHGLQGEGADGRDAAKAGGTSPQETPAGGQKGWREQKPDHREAHQDQQGQNQEHKRAQSQAGTGSHGEVLG